MVVVHLTSNDSFTNVQNPNLVQSDVRIDVL